MNGVLIHERSRPIDPYDFDASAIGIVAALTIVLVAMFLWDARKKK